jgi:DNA-binding NarL/FixJ family response regulator
VLLDAIHAAARGQALVSSHVTASMLQEFVRRGPTRAGTDLAHRLTTSERRVVGVLSRGVTSNEAIAEHLNLSVHTVRSHLHSAMRKVGLDDRTQLALWGARHSIT